LLEYGVENFVLEAWLELLKDLGVLDQHRVPLEREVVDEPGPMDDALGNNPLTTAP